VWINVGAVLQMGGMVPGDRREDGTGACTGGYVEIASDRDVVGRGDFRGGWGHSFPCSVFFSARFDRSIVKGKVGNHHGVLPGTHADEENCFAALSFGNIEQLELHVGISYVSIAKARASIDREVAGKRFDAVRKEAAETWERALSRICVEGGTDAQRALFYTQFTWLLCMPSDLGIDDEFPLWHSGIRHLDLFFDVGHYHSKETMLHVPWLYIYASCPDRAAERVRECMDRFFRPTRDGLSDNEDMGCQSAFYMCAAMGLYLLGQPVFSHVELELGHHGKVLTIEAPEAGSNRPYIAAAALDGVSLNRAWLRHNEIEGGTTLRLELSERPTQWGRDLPPPSPLV